MTRRASPDSHTAARAAAAFDGEWQRVEREIEAVRVDRSLTPEQRAAALHILRQRQKAQADQARRRVMDEERAAARLRSKQERRPTPAP